METQKDFQHESIEDRESIIKYLKTLSDGFRKGQVEFRSGRNNIVLEPTGLIQIEIKVKNHNRKSKLSIKFVWKDLFPRKKEKALMIELPHE
jgi:amphi-Trp domain-containing protein